MPCRINKPRFDAFVAEYKKVFLEKRWPNVKNNLEDVKLFQDNWDANAEEFAEMLKKALPQSRSLLNGSCCLEKAGITSLAINKPDSARTLFNHLFNEAEEKGLSFRLLGFIFVMTNHLGKNHEDGRIAFHQYECITMKYLWLRYPELYYIYETRDAQEAYRLLCHGYLMREEDNIYASDFEEFEDFYDRISEELRKDDDIRNLLDSQLTPECYDDPMLHTITSDLLAFIKSDVDISCLAI